ncbi:DUF6221 family protein [Streptomyces sp. NRRL WC-3742]|uniref:DUF6221 family protein n=1 Tax=Streptomyces sp. NRRL WC-3742 TaxID=1463934 RepID=UPI0004C51C4A|nr:DUF6221 family protein [Streptomyces sp. NRRL WC-3742]
MNELLAFIRARCTDDNHAYVDVAELFGGRALLDSHLPMLDLVDMLAADYEAMPPSDPRRPGLAYALRSLAQSHSHHPEYQEEWRP